MTSSEEIIARLTQAERKLQEAHGKLMAAREDASEAHTLISAALPNSQLRAKAHQATEAVGRPAMSHVHPLREDIKKTIAAQRAVGNH